MLKVRELIEEINGDVVYCPNPGNSGDSAIATATYQLFDEVGLEYQCVGWDEEFDSTGKTVLYGGGGNLTKNYGHARYFLMRHHKSAKRLIVLPHTIQGHADLLHELNSNVCLFCRERRSFEWVQKHTNGPTVLLEDDLAFYIDLGELVRGETLKGSDALKTAGRTVFYSLVNSFMTRLVTGSPVLHPSPPLSKALDAGAQVLSTYSKQGRSVLMALRTGAERTRGELPDSNIDVSLMFNYGVTPKSTAKTAARAMISLFNAYETIVTNRLHGCILACLLGKDVLFYANNYYKNREVFKYSIRDNYENVTWCGEWGEE